ncbi:thioredoxin family protein [Crocinitomicaceae bacterium]|nr:thioredoxin family protein [Crocinitomicaceae bacterium]
MIKKTLGAIGLGVFSLFVMSAMCSQEPQSSVNSQVTVTKKNDGIRFRSMSLADAKKQALKTGKLIFIDAYTDWCGPCKRMAATSFKDEAVGALYNKNFINIKIEMEKSPEGPDVARKYAVRAYPTLLIIDGTGKLVKQVIGMKNKDQLIAFAKAVL